EDPINIKAVEILGNLHDALAEGGYAGHDLERFLVRILFCLFAEDTGLFEPKTFTLYIENRTAKDGSDLGLHLARLFEVLDTPPERRQKNLDELLAAFPYVNGELFKERLGFADFNRAMRDALVACTDFNWSKISPAIFGSLFQGIMDPKERRQTGGHYTSERDILKVINALFMDALRAEFEKARRSKAMLRQFHKKLGALRFFDPACGCGNFLVITYRELRLLEVEVLKEQIGKEVQQELDVQSLSCVDVDAFTGIEIQEWPARIAEVAMWLMEHQMNTRLSEAFGQYFARLPLRKSAHIHLGNALRLDWKAILPPEHCSYVLGNPPFIGKQFQEASQKADMELIWGKVKGAGVLDYVTCWYTKAADYIQATAICVGFVSTNSISQGEQVGVLWNALFQRNVKIHFAYRTFAWASEARGKAHVHVVIIGFGCFNPPEKRIYECNSGKVTCEEVRNISPYLIEGNDVVAMSRSTAVCSVPEMIFGSMPNDGGNLLLDDQERTDLVNSEPQASKWIRPFLGSQEFINGETRWCLWLDEVEPHELRGMPEVLKRVEAVRKVRSESVRETTRKLAASPTRFGENRQPQSDYLLVPGVSSERRSFIPIGYLTSNVIASNLVNVIPDATLYHFGLLTSTMHMAWMRQVCGRLESRYRYSAGLVYNNFPWPENPTAQQNAAVEAKAQAVLDARAKYPLSTLADLYDPLTMPADLVKAHADLDRAVDQCYRKQPFTSDRQRVEFLFALYER
ncbi:MAG: class I SAM-dependent DNA methyltransferase, partial [Terrimicrobiaceae bacterium]